MVAFMRPARPARTPARAWPAVAFALALSAGSVPALADDTLAASESYYALYPPPAPAAGQWRYTVGAGVVNLPTFPGADDQRTEVVPVLAASRGRFFIGANPDTASLLSVGAYLVQDAHWRAGVAATYDVVEPRQESDDAHLRGLGDLDRTAHAELFGVYVAGWASLRGSLVTDIGGNSRGTYASFDAMGSFPLDPRWVVVAGPGLSWGNDQYMRAYYGIDATQSADSGLPAYRAGSGLYSARFSLGANYRPQPGWNIGANLALAWLQSDASDSPVTQRNRQLTATVLVSRAF